MKHIFIACFVMFLTIYSTSAQSAEKDFNDQIPAKWEVGIDILPLFKMSHLPQNTLFFRRNYAINDRACKAFRFRMGFDSEDRYAIRSLDSSVLVDNTTYSPYLALGHEWKFLHRQYRWYIGTEASGQLTHENLDFLGIDPAAATYNNHKIRNKYLAVNGIFGLQYFIANKISISVESSVEIRYIHEKLETIGRGSNGTLVSYGGYDRTVITSNITPVFSFNFNYSLEKRSKR